MDMVSECIPCLVRQSLDALRRATPDESRRLAGLRAALRLLAEVTSQPPPLTAAALQALICEHTSCADPYQRDKEQTTRLALALLPHLREVVRLHPRPFEAACRLAVAGNIIDFGVADHIAEDRVERELADTLSGPFDTLAVGAFERLAQTSRRTLWLCDNAGEIVLDRLLIERLPTGSVTVAVKSGPALNDATLADAMAAGLGDVSTVIETGAAIPGTVLAHCSPAFRQAFGEADLVVAKGQGNYETLEREVRAPIVFLMKVKCGHVSRHTGLPMGTAAVVFSAALAAENHSA